jgi:phosphoheptose isomerase
VFLESIVTIALVGGDGGKIAARSDVDYCLVVESNSRLTVLFAHLKLLQRLVSNLIVFK